MHLSHINVTMPKGSENMARSFYGGHLGLREIPKPEPLRIRGGVWFEAGGLDIHLSVEEQRFGPDAQRHFGMECADVDGLRAKLKTAGVEIDDGRPAPWLDRWKPRHAIRSPAWRRSAARERSCRRSHSRSVRP